MQTTLNSPAGGEIEVLLNRGCCPHRTALEDYVAYQWEETGDLLGQRHGARRNATALKWLSEAVGRSAGSSAVLDVGCSYGNHIFMLNALLKKPGDVEFVGVDLFAQAIHRANTFANTIPGFCNCHFQVADLSSGLPFEDGYFDAVNLCDVIEHMTDPAAALRELSRILKTNGTLVISTPLKDSIFKRIALVCDRISGGRLYGAYYRGKDTELDEHGKPIMTTPAGHDHVSEMTLATLRRVCAEAGFRIDEVSLMAVMSGSRWFDKHPLLMAGLLLVETIHDRLQCASWAHSVMLRLRKTR